MEILLIAKGFVTNSSSANYWLDDGALEENEIASTSQNKTILNKKNLNLDNVKINNSINKEIQQKQIIQENRIVKDNASNFFIWLIFSLIFVFALIFKKIKSKNKI
ncbi:hypothetical protein KAU09_05200 [Candidatus Parcubacteria bacterium]|nr:hypothetical protein [Candidatus Parcubacteria bacterium]